MRDKRGLEIAINTLILMILGIVVLIAIVLFFVMGAEDFGGHLDDNSVNVDEVIVNCNSYVTRDAKYMYCCEEKTVRFSKESSVKVTCDFARDAEWASGRINELDCSAVSCLKS